MEEAGSQEQQSTKVAPQQCQCSLWGDARTSSHTPGVFGEGEETEDDPEEKAQLQPPFSTLSSDTGTVPHTKHSR